MADDHTRAGGAADAIQTGRARRPTGANHTARPHRAVALLVAALVALALAPATAPAAAAASTPALPTSASSAPAAAPAAAAAATPTSASPASASPASASPAATAPTATPAVTPASATAAAATTPASVSPAPNPAVADLTRPALVPQPTAWLPPETPGEWRPDASTRVLIVTEQPAAFPASAPPPPGLDGPPADGTRPDTRPSTDATALAAEAARLGAELAALGVVPNAPELLVLTPLEANREARSSDLRLRIGTEPLGAANAPTRDEAGRLQIESGRAALVAARTDAGLFRAGRALLQLLTAHGGAAPAGVYDFVPASQVRSVHIDIARKAYSLAWLMRLVDELAWNGFTELELHVSEFEGFALQSERYPELSSPGALSLAELRALLAYADAQHVRVTPSLDMPGHLEHVLDAHPELRLRAADGSEVYGALDITNPAAIAFAHDLIDEYAAIFEPGPWNLGADEFVDFGDANEVAALTAAARAAHGPDATASDALTAFVNDTAAHLAGLGFSTRVWSDGMLRARAVTLDPAVEVAHWTMRPRGAVDAAEFADAGYRLVNVNDEYLYFVLGERVGYRYPTGEAILDVWRPARFAGDIDLAGRPEVAGAMFAIWSDIPEALTEDEVLERARLPLQAMSVRAVAPDAPLTWAELVAVAVVIGPAPAGLEGVQAAPIVPPPLAPDATLPASSAAQPDAGAIAVRIVTMAAWVVVAAAAITFVVALATRRRARRRG